MLVKHGRKKKIAALTQNERYLGFLLKLFFSKLNTYKKKTSAVGLLGEYGVPQSGFDSHHWPFIFLFLLYFFLSCLPLKNAFIFFEAIIYVYNMH